MKRYSLIFSFQHVVKNLALALMIPFLDEQFV